MNFIQKIDLKLICKTHFSVNRIIKKLIVFSISIQLLMPIPGIHFSAYAAGTKNDQNFLKIPDFSSVIIQSMREKNPLWDEFFKSKEIIRPQFSKDTLDENPFFLKGQRWESLVSHSYNNGISYTKNENGLLQLHLEKLNLTLSIPNRISPVFFNDEYIFLSADKNSTLSRDAHGLFFISYEELLKKAVAKKPTNIYFFPLPGKEYTGNLRVDSIDAIDSLMVQPESNDAPIELSLGDVRQVHKVETLNAMLASSLNIKGQSSAIIKNIKLTKKLELPLPPRGSTAAFGMIFTGMNLDSPEDSIWEKTSLVTEVKDLFKNINLMSVAQADVLESLGMDKKSAEALKEKMTSFAWIFGAVTATSVAVKYLFLRERFKERRALHSFQTISGLKQKTISKLYHLGIQNFELLSKMNPEDLQILAGTDEAQTQIILKEANQKWSLETQRSPLKRVGVILKTEALESIDSMAHSLLSLMQLSRVVTASLIQRVAERYFPEQAAGESKIIFKALNNIVYWARKSNAGAPVSAKTFWLGSVVMGTVDSSIVAYQEMKLIPDLCNASSEYLPEFLQQRVTSAFDPSNSNTKSIVVNDVIRNYISWMTSGAASYAAETQAQQEPIVRMQIEQAMKREGKNPLDPAHADEKDRRFNELLNNKMKQMGLPDHNDFLYDANTVDSLLSSSLGFSVKKKSLSPELQASFADASFAGESHSGLVLSSIELVTRDLQKELKETPDSLTARTLRLAEETTRQVSWLSVDLSSPKASLGKVREARAMLTLLTYSGEVGTFVKAVPELWKNIDPEAADQLAKRYRQKFFSLLTGNGDVEKLPKQFVTQNKKKAMAIAEQNLLKKYSQDWKIKASNGEVALQLEAALRTLYSEEKQAKEDAIYTLKRDKKYLAQEKKALRRTQEQVAIFEASGKNVSEDEFKRIFAEESAREIGLYLDTKADDGKELLKIVEARTSQYLESQIEKDTGLAALLAKSTEEEKLFIKRSLYAENFIEQYRSATVDEQILGIVARPDLIQETNDQGIISKAASSVKRLGESLYSSQALTGPISPSQPGITQKIRQTTFFRHSEIATRFSRIIDSFFSDEGGGGIALGEKANRYRKIPAYFDLTQAIARNAKVFAISSTSVYAFNQMFWGIQIPFVSYAFMNTLAWTIIAPSQWLNRAMRMQGLQPMGGVISKVIYGIPYAAVTFTGAIPWLLFTADVQVIWAKMILALSSSELAIMLAHFSAHALPFAPALLVFPLVAELARRANIEKLLAANGQSMKSLNCTQLIQKFFKRK